LHGGRDVAYLIKEDLITVSLVAIGMVVLLLAYSSWRAAPRFEIKPERANLQKTRITETDRYPKIECFALNATGRTASTSGPSSGINGPERSFPNPNRRLSSRCPEKQRLSTAASRTARQPAA
jgi:hypothetical protein